MNTKIKIAGAGPAGLSAAICLAKKGYPVEIFEARDCVGGRFIGDFQVIENSSRDEDICELLKRIGISTEFFFKPVHQSIFYDHKLKPTPVKSRKPFAYFIRRGSEKGALDAGLLAQALEAGANIAYNQRVAPDAVDIVATGPTVPDGLAKEMTFSCDLGETVSVLFDHRLSPGGYSYLFVLDGQATFGCAITRDFDHINNYFNASFNRFQEIHPFSTANEKTGYSFMNFCIKSSAQENHRLYAGEVAGFQDYLFGLGIRYALTTGFAAAESIIQKEDYDLLWNKEIGQAQETSLVNRFLYEKGGNAGLRMFIAQAGRQDLKTYLNKWHRPNSIKKLLYPFVKWALGEKNNCQHHISKHWCRSKPTSTIKTQLGPTQSPSDRQGPMDPIES